MPIRLGRFEMPNRLAKDDATSKGNYAKFVAEPFEAGYGHTLGNSLRRVLLSSLEGASISSIKLEGAVHEFATLPGVVEDVTDIVLNLKKVLFKLPNRDTRVLFLNVVKEGPVTAGDIKLDAGVEILNPDQVIATLDKKQRFEMELEVKVGRGYCSAEYNKHPDQSIGVIAVDSLFSPVRKVKYSVENTRVGQRTDYDKLILEIWTDGRLTPDESLLQASAILRHHLDLFVDFDKEKIEFEESQPQVSQENSKLKKLLNMSVNEIELSVRAANCLNNANITTVGQLAMKTEAEMLKYRNFGKKSLNEIKEKLQNLGLSLGMKLEPRTRRPSRRRKQSRVTPCATRKTPASSAARRNTATRSWPTSSPASSSTSASRPPWPRPRRPARSRKNSSPSARAAPSTTAAWPSPRSARRTPSENSSRKSPPASKTARAATPASSSSGRASLIPRPSLSSSGSISSSNLKWRPSPKESREEISPAW